MMSVYSIKSRYRIMTYGTAVVAPKEDASNAMYRISIENGGDCICGDPLIIGADDLAICLPDEQPADIVRYDEEPQFSDIVISAEPPPDSKTKEYIVKVEKTGYYDFVWDLIYGTGTAKIYNAQNKQVEWANGEIKGDATFRRVRLYEGKYRVVVTYSENNTEPEGKAYVKPSGSKTIRTFDDLAWDMSQWVEPYLSGVVALPDLKDTKSKAKKPFSLTTENIKVQAFKISSGYKIKTTGKLSLSILGFTVATDVYNDKYVEIYLDNDFKYKDLEINASFTASLKNFKDGRKNIFSFLGGGIRNASLTFDVDTKNGSFKFAGTIGIQTKAVAGGHSIATFGCSVGIKNWQWDSVGVTASSVNYLIDPAHQIYLQDIAVKGEGFANSNSTISGSANFSMLKEITIKPISWLGISGGKYRLVEFGGGITWNIDKGDFSIDGHIKALGDFITIEGKIEKKNGKYSISGTGILKISDNFRISISASCTSQAFTLTGKGNLTIPESWWTLNHKITAEVNIGVYAGFGDENSSYFMAQADIDGVKKEYRYYFSTGNEKRVGECKSVLEVYPSYGAEDEIFSSAYEKTYYIEEKISGQDLIFINSFVSPVSNIAWEIISSKGDVYRSDNFQDNDNIYISENSGELLKIGIKDAHAGYWTIKLSGDSLSEDDVSTVAGIVDRTVDRLDLRVNQSRAAEVEFSMTLESQHSGLTVSLYFDDDNTGYDGSYAGSVVADENGTFVWALPEELTESNYYFYVMVSSEDLLTVFSDYTECTSIHPAYSSIDAENLQIYHNCYDTDNAFSISWDFVNSGNVASEEFYSLVIVSDDMVYSDNDLVVSTVWHSPVNAQSEIHDVANFVVGDEYLSGEYYIGIVANYSQSDDTIDCDYDNVSWVEFNAENSHESSNYGQLLTTPTWNQHSPWNDYCPKPTENSPRRTILGCGAVAVAEVVYALKQPKSLYFNANDSYSYNNISIDSDHDRLDFPSFSELNEMLADIKFDGSEEDMAAVAFAVAVKLESEFGVNNTSSYTYAYVNFLLNDCGFDSTHQVSVTDSMKSSDGSFKQAYIDVIADNIANGTPVMLRLVNTATNAGHLVVVEDYDKASNKFYINMGWGGNSDGWYELDNIGDGYSTTDFFLDIIPEYDGSVITVTTTDDYGVGSLRRAVELANAVRGANTIVIDPSLAGQTIVLDSRLNINDQVTIVGLADAGVTVTRNYDGYVFYLANDATGSLISGLTVDGGGSGKSLIYNYSEDSSFANLKFQNFSGTYGLYSYSYAATVDASSDFNGYATRGTVVRVPNAVKDLNAVVYPSGINFSWSAVQDREDGTVGKYRLEYSISEDFADPVSVNVSGLSYLLTGANAGVNYFWRVAGIDSSDNIGIFSDVQRMFSGTDEVAPTAPDGLVSETDDIRVTLSWNAAADAGSGVARYLVRFSESTDMSDSTELSVTSATAKLSGLKNNCSYYWQVATVDREGNIGDFSAVESFTTSVDFVIIATQLGEKFASERNIMIQSDAGITVDAVGNGEKFLRVVELTGYESKIYSYGDITLQNGEFESYGIYGQNITDGIVSGSITLTSDYYDEEGYTRGLCGMFASNLHLSEFSATVNLTGQSDIYTNGFYISDAYLEIDEFSGDLNSHAEIGAYGFRSGREIEVGNVAASGKIDVRSEQSGAYGFYTYEYNSGEIGFGSRIELGSFAGTMTVTSDSAIGYGFYNYVSNSGSAAMTGRIAIGDFSGTLSVSGGSSAYGVRNYVYNNGEGSIFGGVEIGDLSGTVSVAGETYAYGVYSYNGGLDIYDLSGVMTVSSEEEAAYGCFSNSQTDALTAAVSGVLAVNSGNTGYAFRGTGQMNITVSGAVFAGGCLADGTTYRGSDAVIGALLETGRRDASIDIDLLTSADRYYAVYSTGSTDDTVTLNDGALVIGNVALGGGNDSLTVSSGARLFGNITASGNLDLRFSIGGLSADPIITTSAPGVFASSSGSFTITLDDACSGTYSLLSGAAVSYAASKQFTIAEGEVNETVAVGDSYTFESGTSVALAIRDGELQLDVLLAAAPAAFMPGDLNGDGRADIVMTIAQDGHPADGATGAWLITDTQTAAWGDLSQRNATWEIFGTGVTAAGKTTNDVYVKSSENVIGAWVTNDTGAVVGWETVGEFDAATNILGLGDFNGDGQTDLLLRNDNGAVGCYFTSGETLGWNYFQSLGDEWKLCAVGDFNGDGRDDVVLKHDAGFAGSWLTQSDYTMAWADLDTLQDGFEIVGTGDFDGDGTSDVLLQFGAWIVENGSVKSWMGLGDLGSVTVEQIADFDGDGIDDLRIRTEAGDLGAQLVKGADTLDWHYYGSVGSEWSTSLAAI